MDTAPWGPRSPRSSLTHISGAGLLSLSSLACSPGAPARLSPAGLSCLFLWTATPLSSQPEGCFHHESLALHPTVPFPDASARPAPADKPRLSRSECPQEGVRHARSPSGTALLCTLKHRFSFSLSIHQNLEVSSVNPPILPTLIHLLVKLKSRLSLVVSTCNASPCRPDGTFSSLSRGLHVHGLWASTALTTTYYHTNWEQATHKTVFPA